MKMNFNLNLIQTQKLIMTPELKQALEILQFNSVELNDFIEEELLNNPVLERDLLSTETDKDKDEVSDLEDIEFDTNSEFDNASAEYIHADDDHDWDHAYKTLSYTGSIASDQELNYDNFVADEETLKDYLLMQLKLSKLDDKSLQICEYIIENIDDNGYLQMNNEEAAIAFNQSEEVIEQMIRFVQTFDPPGVCARNIKECLLIQLYQQGYEESLEETLVQHHLEALGQKRLAQVAKQLDVSVDRVQAAYDTIKTLEPKPGRLFCSMRSVRYVVPDVYVEKNNGEYLVVINESASPKLKINDFYHNMLAKLSKDAPASDYLNKNIQSALKIIKSIEQRRQTIYRVCTAIVAYQYDFLEKGMLFLKPLNLKDIADEIEVHESTVSRAISGKYIQCPNGLFEIKYFFQNGVKNSGGEGVSSESVKVHIKEMIDSEDTHKPISDQYIADILVAKGINISRRTVAKYRDEMEILPSSKRKRF